MATAVFDATGSKHAIEGGWRTCDMAERCAGRSL
jgi:hypothetical protein